MARWSMLERDDGVRLACADFGGSGRGVLLLHGLAGWAGEWAETAAWLAERCRVVSFDARGHGRSTRRPEDVTRAAHIEDAAFVIERMGLAPAVVVGQSLGGQTALLLAAARPSLVAGLVLADAGPEGGDPSAAAAIGERLRRWPVPFGSNEAAVAHFGGPSLRARAWADGLERRGDGWRPRFDPDVLERVLGEALVRPCWREWEAIRSPVLVVRGDGDLTAEDGEEMARRLPGTRVVELPGAGHDLHLDAPAEWREALTAFLDTLPAPPPR